VLATLGGSEHNDVVRIGTSDGFSTVLLPIVLTQFAEVFSNARARVFCGDSAFLAHEVEAGHLDLALLSTSSEFGGAGEYIRDEQLSWVAAAKNKLQESDPLPLALLPNGCACRNVALSVLKTAERPWKVVLESNSVSTILAAVSAGIAISAIEDCIVPRHFRRLTERDGLPRLGSTHTTLQRRSNALSRGANLFANCLTTYLKCPEYCQLGVEHPSQHQNSCK
jgi:DNA-binding transcriptional LysR family regulator